MSIHFKIDLQTFIDHSDDMVGIFDADFRVIYFNSKFENFFLITEGIRIKRGENFQMLLSREKKSFWSDQFIRAVNGQPVKIEFPYDGSTGLSYEMENSYQPVKDKDEVIYVIQVLRILSSIKKVETLNRSKDNILGIVAHDLRNPITAIIELADLLKNDAGQSDKYFDMINRSCYSALGIINGLLDITELDSPDYSLKTEPVELISFLNNLIETNTVLATDKELEIELKSNVSEIMIQLNGEKFSRVLNNLLVNAMKFSHRHGKISVYADMLPESSCVVIQVQDHGIGIPDSMKSMIFDKFTKAGRRGTEGEKSLGLGMSIVKRIVELHDGRIWLESMENAGTTIFIELPLLTEKSIQTASV